jgi:hypothetical protein
MIPDSYKLSDIGPVVPQRFTFSRPLTFSGRKHEDALVARMNEAADYDVKGLFGRFMATIGVDDATGDQSSAILVEFVVSGDGRELWRSGPLKKGDPAIQADVDISNVQILSLKVLGPQTRGWGRGGVAAGWADALVRKK